MTDCRWWLSLLSNSRNMNCQGWDDWQWAGAAAAGGAIWQSFSGFADVRKFTINQHLNIQICVVRIKIWKNDITDHRRQNQLKDTFETVILVKDPKQLETDILNCWISCQYQIDRERILSWISWSNCLKVKNLTRFWWWSIDWQKCITTYFAQQQKKVLMLRKSLDC